MKHNIERYNRLVNGFVCVCVCVCVCVRVCEQVSLVSDVYAFVSAVHSRVDHIHVVPCIVRVQPHLSVARDAALVHVDAPSIPERQPRDARTRNGHAGESRSRDTRCKDCVIECSAKGKVI